MTRLRELAHRYAPAVMAQRARRYERDQRQAAGVTDAARRLFATYGNRVLHGAFAGLALDSDRLEHVDAAGAKLLGVYEQEIASVMADPYPLFVDIGCADGYYAVGVALAHPETHVRAYDLAKSARDLCSRTADGNGVGARVEIRRGFDERAAEEVALDGALVLCDIEGGERHLFTSRMAAAMKGATIVVELHEVAAPDALHHVTSLFSGTHVIETVDQRERDPAAYPELADFPRPLAAAAIDEMRGEMMRWAVMRPR